MEVMIYMTLIVAMLILIYKKPIILDIRQLKEDLDINPRT
jgi:ABC-type glucose/galactose transport system permease subunit